MMSFVECLFNSDESTCFSPSPYGTRITPIANVNPKTCAFFSINPLDNTKTRADSAVIKYRNILIEFDKLSLEEQEKHVTSIGMPYSTVVYSGSKSRHYIISLEQDLPDQHIYRTLVRRIYKAVGESLVDKNCKNPSRFSRLPGHIRPDTNKEQTLLGVRGRVPNSVLEEWLQQRGVKQEEMWDNLTPEARSTFKNPGRLYVGTKNFLMYGAQSGEWNPKLFKAAADMYRCGYAPQDIHEELLRVTGTLDFSDRKTIDSAIRNEEGKNK